MNNIDINVSSTDNSQESDVGTISGNMYLLNQNSGDMTMEVKEDMTAEELKAKSEILVHPINWTDPIVWHDPTIIAEAIVLPAQGEINEYTPNDNPVATHKVMGIAYPIVKLNQRIISEEELEYFKLESVDILPELYIEINDSNGIISNTNASGLNNSLTVAILAPINGVYRKIKQTFYVNKVIPFKKDTKSCLGIYAVLKVPELFNKYTTAMNYPEKTQFPKCEKCQKEAQQKPNSWEMLHYIANYCKLGFQSTHDCKDISDRDYRLFNIYNNLEECLSKELEFAGTDEETAIFDWWVDFYYYITMVNLPYILKNDITPEHLGVYGIVGINAATSNPIQEPVAILTNRTITNSTKTTTAHEPHNLLFENYKIISNNKLYLEGTCTTTNIFVPIGAGGNNAIDMFDVQVLDNSVSGLQIEDYTTQQTVLQGIDMSGTNKLKRVAIFSKYKQNKQSKLLEITLKSTNLGLQRGMLVNVIINETNPVIKSHILHNVENLLQPLPEEISDEGDDGIINPSPEIPQSGKPNDDPTSLSIESTLLEPSAELVNFSLSGLYYIHSVRFEYNKNKENTIFQILTLIKKGAWTNYSAPNAPIKLNTQA